MTHQFPIKKFDFEQVVAAAIENARRRHNDRWQNVSVRPGDPFEARLFQFTRLCRSISAMKGLEPHQALEVVETAFRTRKQGWRDLAGISDEDEAQIEFLYLWDAIRFGVGEEPLKLARQKAQAQPLNLDLRRFPTKLYRRFLSFAFHLQSIMGERCIFLPCAAMSRVMGCTAQSVSNMSRAAQSAGLLGKVKEHSFSGRKAAEYKVDTGKLLSYCDQGRPFEDAIPEEPEPDTPF